MKKFFIIGTILLIILFCIWFFIIRDTNMYTIKKSGEYTIKDGVNEVIINAKDVTIKNSDVAKINVVNGENLKIKNSTVKFLEIENNSTSKIEIDDRTLLEYLNVLEVEKLYVNGDFSIINLKSNNSKIYLEKGVVGNVYSNSSNIYVDASESVSITNYFLVKSNSVKGNILGKIHYLELDESSRSNEFNVFGKIDLIVNEGENNKFNIINNGKVDEIKTSKDILGNGEIDTLTKQNDSISVSEIISKTKKLNPIINERKEVIKNIAIKYEIKEEVINKFLNDTGFSTGKIKDIAVSLESSSYSLNELLDLSTKSGVTNYQIKEIITYTDNSSLSAKDVVNLFDKLNMTPTDIKSSLDITYSCGLSISDLLDIYETTKSSDNLDAILLLKIKDDYNLSAKDITKLGAKFSQYIK